MCEGLLLFSKSDSKGPEIEGFGSPHYGDQHHVPFVE